MRSGFTEAFEEVKLFCSHDTVFIRNYAGQGKRIILTIKIYLIRCEIMEGMKNSTEEENFGILWIFKEGIK